MLGRRPRGLNRISECSSAWVGSCVSFITPARAAIAAIRSIPARSVSTERVKPSRFAVAWRPSMTAPGTGSGRYGERFIARRRSARSRASAAWSGAAGGPQRHVGRDAVGRAPADLGIEAERPGAHAQVGDHGAAGQVGFAALRVELPQHLVSRIAGDPERRAVDLDAPALRVVRRRRTPGVVEQPVAQFGTQRGRLAPRYLIHRIGTALRRPPRQARSRLPSAPPCGHLSWPMPDLGTLLPPFVRKKDLDFAERTVARALRLLLAGRFAHPR